MTKELRDLAAEMLRSAEALQEMYLEANSYTEGEEIIEGTRKASMTITMAADKIDALQARLSDAEAMLDTIANGPVAKIPKSHEIRAFLNSLR